MRTATLTHDSCTEHGHLWCSGRLLIQPHVVHRTTPARLPSMSLIMLPQNPEGDRSVGPPAVTCLYVFVRVCVFVSSPLGVGLHLAVQKVSVLAGATENDTHIMYMCRENKHTARGGMPSWKEHLGNGFLCGGIGVDVRGIEGS